MFSVFKKIGKEEKTDRTEPQKGGIGSVQPKGIGNTKTVATTQQELDIKTESPIAKTPLITTYTAPAQTISVSSSAAIEEEVATNFSEGENETSITILKNYIHAHQGKVHSRVWFMLMDLYQILDSKQDFDKTALAFAQLFSTSPPSWFGEITESKKENIGGGKNMIILEPILKNDYVDKFKAFLKSAKEEKFCRINVSQCKFEQNEVSALEKVLKLFIDLRKAKVTSVLMGDNNLISFCKEFISNQETKKASPELQENPQIIWLIYLELLQWKGLQEEFEEIALEYAEKFEISPPGFEIDGIMNLKNVTKETEEDTFSFDKNLNINNINPLLDYIKERFDSGNDAEIDFSHIDRVDFSAAGAISFHIQELWSNPNNQSKKVIFKYPNELIIVLLEMVGCNEFVQIIPRNRK